MSEKMKESLKKIEEFSTNFLANQSKEETLIIIYSDGNETYQKVNSTRRNSAFVVATFLVNNPVLMDDINNSIEEM